MKRTLLLLLFALSLSYWGWGQILTFEFSALAGNETTAASNFNNANLSSSTISRGSGLDAASNSQRFNAANWALTSISNAITGNDYMEFTITPNSGYQFSVTSIVVQWQRSSSGNTAISLRSSVDNYASDLDAVKTVTDNTSTQTFTWTFTQANSSTAVTYRFYSYAEAVLGTGGPGDGAGNDIVVNGSVTSTGNTAPTVTTQAVSNIGTTTATGNGNITATGGVNPDTRGVCWVLYSNGTDPTTSDFKAEETGGSFGTGAFTESMTSNLAAETRYKLKAYAINSVGTGYGSLVNFWTLSTEPSSHTTTFSNTPISQTQIDLAFDAASTITNADGYLILLKTGSTPTGLPSDGTAYSVGNAIGDATVAAIITSTSATTSSVTGLSAGTSYYFSIIPYNYNGTDAATYNYKTDGTVPGTNGSTLAPLDITSEISGPVIGSQPNPVTISSLTTTEGSAIRVFDMDAYDYGTDGQPTKVTQITIKSGANNTANWANSIQGVRLSIDGGSSFVTIGTPTIASSSIIIPISSGNLNVPDADALTISLYVYLKSSGLTDNQILEFKADATTSSHGFTADATGSTFLATFASATVSNLILIDVVATILAFVQQPTNVGTSTNITPAVTISANDANNNRDLDYVTNVAVSATGLTGSPVSVTPTAGLATFSTLSFAAAATGVALDANSGTLTGITSSFFDIFLIPVAGEIVINQISPDYSGASDEYIELVNRTNKSFDLSQLKIEYQSSGGTVGGAGGNLTGTIGPYQYWLLSPNTSITIGQTTSLARDGAITAGFAASSAQIALRLKNSPNTIIDGIAYGSVSPNNLGEGTAASSPPADGGLKRVSEGIDNNTNSTDFTTVTQANIYLRNSNSVCIASNYTLPSASYSADVVVSGTSPAVTLTGNTTIAGKLTVASGSLTIGSSQTLTVTGTLTNNAGNAGLVIKSDATGTGSLITTSSPSSTVERYMSKDNYHYISSPVASQAISTEFINTSGGGTLPSEIDFYTWDETQLNSWINIKQADFTLNPAFETNFGVCKGYVYANSSSAVTKNFTGTLNSGDKTVTLTKSPLGQRGWNMVGNPFASSVAVNVSADATNNLLTLNTASLNDSREAIYLWNQTTPNTSTHTTNEYLAINQASPATFLSPGQAFMVSASANSVSFSLPQAARKHGSATFYKSGTEDEVNRFWLTVEGPQNNFNETMVALIPGTTNGMDAGYDAQKLKGNVNIALYTRLVDGSEGDYAIQSIDQLSGNFVVPVGLDANLTGNYTFKSGRMDNLEAVTVQLEDRNSGTFTTLSNGGEYSIAVGTKGTINNRFFLHLKSTVGIDDPANQEASSIYAYGNQLYIQNPGKATLEVYSMTGQRVMASQINTTGLYQATLSQPTGYYVVRLTNAGSTQVSKVFIK